MADEKIYTNIGHVTAYAYAKSKGYTGSEDQFATDQANFAANAQQVRGDKESVEATVETFDNTTVPAAVQTVTAEGTRQVGIVGTAGDTQVGVVQTEGTTQKNAVQAKGNEVIASIPSDYTELTEEVEDLKSSINASDFVAISSSTKWQNYGIDASTGNAVANEKRLSLVSPISFNGGTYKVYTAPDYYLMVIRYSINGAALYYDGYLKTDGTYAKSSSNVANINEFSFTEGINNGYLYNLILCRQDNGNITASECANLKINVYESPFDQAIIDEVKDLFVINNNGDISWEVGGFYGSTGEPQNYSYCIRPHSRISIQNQRITLDPSKVRLTVLFYSAVTSGYIGRVSFAYDTTTNEVDLRALAPSSAKYFQITIHRVTNGEIDTTNAISTSDIPDILEYLTINSVDYPKEFKEIEEIANTLTVDGKNEFAWIVGSVNPNTGDDNNAYEYALRNCSYFSDLDAEFIIDPSKIRLQFYFYTGKGTGFISRENLTADSTTTSFKVNAIMPPTTKYYRVTVWRIVNGSLDTSNPIAVSDIPSIIANLEIPTFAQFNNANTSVYNVRDFGAVGDGTTDDASAIQTALTKCNALGGTVYFPSGTYKVGTQLIFYSNTHILLEQDATVLRGAEKNGVFFSHCTNSTLSYNGVQNVIFEGGTIDLGTGITQGGLGIGVIHGNNIVIRNMTFKHINAGYHSIDICCTKNATVKNCIFTDLLTNSEYGECIQIDSADQYASFPSPELSNNAATFDSTPTINVDISGCKFDLNSYSPAIGNHNDIASKRIFFHDNIIIGNGGTRGAVAFDHYAGYYSNPNATTEIMIHHNIFEDCTYGFKFDVDGTGKAYIRDNIFKDIGTLKINPTSDVGEFLNNIELTS